MARERNILMSLKEYKPGSTFTAVIGHIVAESSPAWSEPLRAKAGSPNVIFFVLGAGDISFLDPNLVLFI
jgi:hypothetical protein